MAIAFDAQSVSAYSAGTSVTWAHTCTGSDRILFVAAYCGTSAAFTATYNGVSMTAIDNRAMSGAATGQFIRLWYLLNPASGTNNCVLTSTSDMYGFSASYTGALQSGQPDSFANNGSSSTTSLTTTTTTIADNSWLVGIIYSGAAPTAGANTTFRSGITNVLYIVDSNSAQTPAGSHSINFTLSTNFAGAVIASFSPLGGGGGGGTTYRRLALLGVGN